MWDVFCECDMQDYSEKGIKTFKYFIRRENIEDKINKKDMKIFGAYNENELIGVVCMRNVTHISLLFVKKSYQRRGVAKALLRRAIYDSIKNNENANKITVNASPVGLAAYKAMGFVPDSLEKEEDGMRYTPMSLKLQ